MTSATVHRTDVSIDMPDGVSHGVLSTPSGHGPGPGVLFLSDAIGVRAAVVERASRLAAHGYAVLTPNVCYRSGEPPFFTFPLNFNDEAIRQRFHDMTSALTPAAIAGDAASYVRFMQHQASIQRGPIAVVGHCFSGAIALRMAAAEAPTINCAASFHGGNLYTDMPDSPHRVLPRVTARLYFGHAVEDRSMPAEAIATLEHALEDWGGAYASETYDARHGWTMADHPAFHAVQADLAFERLVALLADTLPRTS